MQKTNIEWTDFSANPLKYRNADGEVVWACIHKSEGCRECYSEKIAMRYKRGGPFTAPVMEKLTPFLDEKELHHMLTYKPASGKMCFVGDMTDIFGEWVLDELLDRLFAVFALRSDVTWQILTKRPERMKEYLRGLSASFPRLQAACPEGWSLKWSEIPLVGWPLKNLRLGVSCEDQKTADERIPELLLTPAAVRSVSYEPALGPVDFRPWLTVTAQRERMLDWIIAGSESGPKARDYETEWFANVARQCEQAGVKFFMKQLTVRGRKIPFEQWPDYLQVREFPEQCRMFVERK